MYNLDMVKSGNKLSDIPSQPEKKFNGLTFSQRYR